MNGDWQSSTAREITKRAARVSANAPTGARARVWQQLEARRSRERDQPARRRLGWAMFTAGVTCDVGFIREELTVTGAGPVARPPLVTLGPLLALGFSL